MQINLATMFKKFDKEKIMAAIFPVLIVGAGPTGLTLAIECCRHGVPFRLIDKLPHRSSYSKALILWQGSLQVFQAQGMLAAFKQQAIPFKCLHFLYQNKILATMDPLEGMPIGTERPLLLAQNETERILTERLNQLGGQIERGIELIAIRPEKDHVVCELKNPEGMTEVITVSWLTACDGARSFIRKYLEAQHEVKFRGYTEETCFQLGDFEFNGDYKNDEINISFNKDSTLAIFPVNHNTVRLISQDKLNQTPTEANMQALLKQHHIDLTLKKPLWLTIFRINERIATHWVKDRIILLGDAAHIHSPAGGQGMNTGIQDAFNLGWKLAHVIHHPHTAQVLIPSYEEERHPIVKKVVYDAAEKLHFAMKNNRFITLVKRLGLTMLSKMPSLRKSVVANLSELNIHYKSEMINDGHWPHYHDGIPAGHKLRDVTLMNAAHNSVSLFESCIATSHVLLIFALDKILDPQLFKDLPKACKLVILHTTESKHLGAYHFFDLQHQAHQLYGASVPCWYLIRPDQFIAKRGYLTDITPINHYFQEKCWL